MFARTTLIALAASLAAGLVGCQSTQPRASSMASLPESGPVPTDSSAALMDYIGGQPLVTADAGYRAAYMLWQGEMFDGDFPALRRELIAAQVIDDCWNHASDTFLTRADVGYMVCRAADINTGLNWMLLGLGRYAYRELQYHQIAGPGGELSLVGGGEFQGIIRRADEYILAHNQTARAELGPRQ